MQRSLCLLALAAVLGCGGDSIPKKEPITLDQVPENVLKVAREKLPDVKFERAMRKPNGEFEVIGRNRSGKVREIDIRLDGTITEVE